MKFTRSRRRCFGVARLVYKALRQNKFVAVRIGQAPYGMVDRHLWIEPSRRF